MKLFKRHKTKDKVTFNVGIRECRTCENNLRCEECVYPSENEMLKSEIERLKSGCKRLVEKQNLYKENTQATREWQIETAKAEAIKEFAERLRKCMGTDTRYILISEFTLNNLVKETVGEQG